MAGEVSFVFRFPVLNMDAIRSVPGAAQEVEKLFASAADKLLTMVQAQWENWLPGNTGRSRRAWRVSRSGNTIKLHNNVGYALWAHRAGRWRKGDGPKSRVSVVETEIKTLVRREWVQWLDERLAPLLSAIALRTVSSRLSPGGRITF